MIGISEKEDLSQTAQSKYDFDLGLAGFKYSDLYDAEKLREIAEKFYDEVKNENSIF